MLNAGLHNEDIAQNKAILEQTVDLVCAHVSVNNVAADQLVPLIHTIHNSLSSYSKKQQLQPAVPVEDSVNDDYLICLEDGMKLKTLKRHIQSVYGLSPEEYKIKWGLSSDYPMVCPSYSKKRSALARQFRLGKIKK